MDDFLNDLSFASWAGAMLFDFAKNILLSRRKRAVEVNNHGATQSAQDARGVQTDSLT